MPKFHCWMNNGETEEDSWEHIASDHYMAAIRFAEEAAYDVGIEDEDEWKDENSVLVKDLETGTVKRFNITREYEPVFSATEVKE